MTSSMPYLSVVVPAYNEGAVIGASLRSIAAFLGRYDRPSEIIVVDDGSTDQTREIGLRERDNFPSLKILKLTRHSGKGAAVREGVLASGGRFVLCTDADASYPIEQAVAYLEVLERGLADIAVGDRRLEESTFTLSPAFFPYIFQRHCIGFTYNVLVRAITGIEQKDTQCGFKCFRGNVARSLFAKSVCDRFSYDVEILFLAKKMGFRIQGMPVHYIYLKQRSSIRLLRDSFGMLADLIKIVRNNRKGLYD